MTQLPKRFEKFQKDYPEVASAYELLGKAVHSSVRLMINESINKTCNLNRAGLEGAVHSHTRKAIELGITKEEIRQTVLLALPTIGLPSTMAAMSWVDDMLEKES